MKRTLRLWFCLIILLIVLAPPFFGTSRSFGSGPFEGTGIYRISLQNRPSAEPRHISRIVVPQQKKDRWSRLKASMRRWMELHSEAVQLYAKWVVGAPILVVAILIGMLLRPRRKETNVCVAAAAAPKRSLRSSTASCRSVSRPKPGTASDELSARVQVLRFFLLLFKGQFGAAPDAPAQIVRIETRPSCPDETYEMRIQYEGEWMTRRMSIGLLGQGGGSRSRCFYVIYDTHMVIKIPAVAMAGFSDYKRRIAAEGCIVERLAPRLCIVPRVSVILKAVHNFAQSDHLSEEMLEAKYVRLLESKPELQEYLKIDGSFAFFMDLAKHFFLSTTLEEIHSGYGRLIDEAGQHPELLWDHDGFVSRYGEDAGTVCHGLQEAYYRCEGRLRQVVEQAGTGQNFPTYHLKQWFLTHMAGESIRREAYDLPADAITKANQLLVEVVRANRPQVERYRRCLTEYIRRTRFSQHRRQLENMASAILDLLAWIGRKKVALRDLKPENLFVAGNAEDYPSFLNDPRKFSLGLIDVETAVPFDAGVPRDIPQPQLAGTPLYATPTHLMSNAVLLEIYEDLPAILHLQDWFATIAILYKIITGENLFTTTAHVFPEILSRLRALDPAGPDLPIEISRIQRLFWNSAMAEFREGMAKYAATLSLVEVVIPEEFIGEIRSVLKDDIREIETTVAKAVSDQNFFNSGDRRHFLKEASADKIGQMKNRLSQETQTDQSLKGQITLFFEILEKLKNRLEVKYRAQATLDSPSIVMPLDQLMEIMFQKVFNAMYLPHWPELTPRLYGSSSFLTTDITTYQATM